MRTYLITGGAGFIGSHLTDALLDAGNQVVVLDNLSTGRISNLDPLTRPGLRFVHGSVLDELAIDELVHQCDVVVHLAAAVGVKLIVEQPLRSLTTNVRGTHVVLEAAHRYRRRILLASTSEIYGKNSDGPLAEAADRILGAPTVARWAYACAKSIDETFAGAFHKERGLPTTIVRMFNTVGPRQSPAYGMVIPRLVRQALTGQPLTVFGDGTQSRCFAHVSDVVNAILRLLDNDASIGGTYNIGSVEEISILDLAEMIVESCHSTSEIQLIPYDQAYESGFEDMQRRVPDTTALSQLTGWKSRHNLDTIIADMIIDAKADTWRPQP